MTRLAGDVGANRQSSPPNNRLAVLLSKTHVNKKSGELRRHEEDVDGDGDTDLVFHFRLGDTNLDCDSEEGTLEGEAFDGQAIQGTDAVRMIGG